MLAFIVRTAGRARQANIKQKEDGKVKKKKLGSTRRTQVKDYKIKRMSIKTINFWLSAIKMLITHYEGKARINGCPLCECPSCNDCLWNIMEGMSCEDLCVKLYGHRWATYYRDHLQFRKWRRARLTQLPRWKKILKAELKRRAAIES